ncbi:MAG: hydroxylamine reductase [Proteobacteria bacterium]|nr:hydroxylamine reductase [Pseudomonadota bacterium]
MYCYQCEQAAKGSACTSKGVCGKDPTVAALQDFLVHATKGIAMYTSRAKQLGVVDKGIDLFVIEALFATVTNVDFDASRFETLLKEAALTRNKARALYEDAAKNAGKTAERLDGPAAFDLTGSQAGLVAMGRDVGIDRRKEAKGDDITGLEELIIYGLKGTAAYADHAIILGQSDDGLNGFFSECLNFLTEDNSIEDLTGMALKVGEWNLKAMELLDAGNTGTYGHPEPTQCRVDPVKGKAILVSGHDLKDLEELLKQTEGSDINVYTHGEMLPCNAYPELKKYKHLIGNYGSAWQNQTKEFANFPGAILMTTNCIRKPAESYNERIFTTGLVGWPGVPHIDNHDYAPVIEAAKSAPGFTEDGPGKTITIGFGHNAVLGVADKVIDAVKSGDIKHFFLIGGCDGVKSSRHYYTELAKTVPDDSVILTLACGKFRFNDQEFGDIGGIPRLLDIGQCNDAHSAIQIALALANAFETDVNSLPLSFILSWYEQKAVCILLSLLHLGVKNIKLGPSLPAFVTPPVLNVLVENFNIAPITTPEEDLKSILG